MDNYLKNKLLSVKFTITFIAILALYLTYWRLGINFGMAIFGIPLLLYFPGKFLIELVPPLAFMYGKFGVFSLAVLYSFCIVCVSGFLIQHFFGFNTEYQIWVIILLDVALYLVYIFLSQMKFWKNIVFLKEIKNQTYLDSWYDYIPLVVMAIALLVLILINPLAQNADNYLITLKESIFQNNFISNSNQYNLDSRQLFNSFTRLTSKFLMLDISFVYRNIFVVLFFFLTFPFYDYLKRNFRSSNMSALLYLFLLAPSVILTEINIIRPQVIILVLTIPIIILSIESVKSKNTLASIVSLGLSIIALLFHELGIILVFIAFVAFSINILRVIFIEKKISWKYLILFFVLAIACFKILDISVLFKPVIYMIKYALHLFTNIRWRWWFINNYKTMDDVSVGWTGISVLFYYLYNGILLLPLLVYLLYLFFKKHLKARFYFIIPGVYFIFYFLIAELLPRIGLFFLPNRAWVHLMIAAVILLALFLEPIEQKQIKIKFILIILITLMAIGYGGSLYVARDNINIVYREELPIANFIKNNTSQDSLILSSQDNLTLVSIYGDRDYIQLIISDLINKERFDSIISDTLRIIASGKVDKIEYSGNNQIYFLYSYRKLSGLNTERPYSKQINDYNNKNIYSNLGYPIVYQDNYALLIKIR